MSDDLHTRLRTAIEEMLAVAKAATPGPWEIHSGQFGTVDESYGWPIGEVTPSLREDEDVAFIAAHDPADAIRRHEAALRSVEIHQPFPHRTGPRCVHCQDGTEPWPCGEFEIVAGAYGVSVEVTP